MSRPSHKTFVEELTPHRAALGAFCSRMVRDRADVEDALQQTLLEAFRRFDTFRPGTNFRAWVLKFAALTIFALNRRRAKEPDALVEEHLAAPEELALELDYDELLARPDLIRERLSDEVCRALDGLTDRERAIFLLKSIGELACADVAHALSLPLGTVMGLLARARGKLRESLADYARKEGFLSEERRP